MDYTPVVLLLVVAFVLAVVGVVRLAQTLEPRQRIVLAAVFLVAVAYLVIKLMQLGLLGHRSAE